MLGALGARGARRPSACAAGSARYVARAGAAARRAAVGRGVGGARRPGRRRRAPNAPARARRRRPTARARAGWARLRVRRRRSGPGRACSPASARASRRGLPRRRGLRVRRVAGDLRRDLARRRAELPRRHHRRAARGRVPGPAARGGAPPGRAAAPAATRLPAGRWVLAPSTSSRSAASHCTGSCCGRTRCSAPARSPSPRSRSCMTVSMVRRGTFAPRATIELRAEPDGDDAARSPLVRAGRPVQSPTSCSSTPAATRTRARPPAARSPRFARAAPDRGHPGLGRRRRAHAS